MLTTILLSLASYCLLTYLIYWLWVIKPFGKVRGCSIGDLTYMLIIFAPIIIPIFVWHEVVDRVRRWI